MTAEQLKKSILQKAVQGKLVPQCAEDEPAAVLLARVREEKARLIKEKKLKKEKSPSRIYRGEDGHFYEQIGKAAPVCIDKELPFEIPESWEWVKLPQIAISELGKTLDKAKNTGKLHPYLCSINVYWTGIDTTKLKQARFEDAEVEKYKLRPGDLLICEGGDVGRSAIWESNDFMCYQNALHRVRFFGNMNPYYFKLVFECYKGLNILDKFSKGMTIKHLVRSSLHALYLPLPPLQEQVRIVEHFNKIKPFLEAYNAEEKSLSALNKNFPERLRKSLLQEAVQGKLVEQDASDEPASALLARIREEKERLIKEKKLKKEKTPSRIYRGEDGKIYEQIGKAAPTCIDDKLPFKIPDSWEWVRLGNVLYIARGGSPRPIKDFLTNAHDGINWIKIGDTDKGGKYIYSTKEKIKVEGVAKSRMVHEGDFLLTNSMSFGRPYILKTSGCIHDGWLVLSDPHQCYYVDFLYYLLSSVLAYYQFCKSASGAVVKNLNCDKVAVALFPLPPLDEQKRIVLKVEEILTLIDSL